MTEDLEKLKTDFVDGFVGLVQAERLEVLKAPAYRLVLDFLTPHFEWRPRLYGFPPTHPFEGGCFDRHCTAEELHAVDVVTASAPMGRASQDEKFLLEHARQLLRHLEVVESDLDQVLRLDEYDPRQIVACFGQPAYVHGCASGSSSTLTHTNQVSSRVDPDGGGAASSDSETSPPPLSFEDYARLVWHLNHGIENELKSEAGKALRTYAEKDKQNYETLLGVLSDATGVCLLVHEHRSKRRFFQLTRYQKLLAALTVVRDLLAVKVKAQEGIRGAGKTSRLMKVMAKRICQLLEDRTSRVKKADWNQRLIDTIGDRKRANAPAPILWSSACVNLTDDSRAKVGLRLHGLMLFFACSPTPPDPGSGHDALSAVPGGPAGQPGGED